MRINDFQSVPELSQAATRRGKREFSRTVRLQAIAWQIGKDQGVSRAEAWKRAEDVLRLIEVRQ